MPGILHVELVEQTPTALQLRLWGDNPNEVRTRTLALAEIEHLVGKAETDYYSPLPAKLQEVGQTLFRWLDGGERWLSADIRAAANQAQVLVLAIAMPHGLAHLPWEVLQDGTTFLVHGSNPTVLPVRWFRANTDAHTPANRPLQALFMASSPQDVQPVLDYEQEEHAILEATQRWPLDLVVEESGSLEELGALLQDYGAGHFDVLHLTGHADHGDDGTPFFLLENSEGRRADATAADFVREVRHRPPVVFLSGCRTGQNAAHGEVRSLSEQLIAGGFRAVLGWGQPVYEDEATLAAKHVYQDLAAGESLPLALVHAHAELREAGAHHWHLLRLFCAGDPVGALVTPKNTPGRKRPVIRLAESEFLDPLTKSVKVATRREFVGRRRLLQRSLNLIRQLEAGRVGMLLHGQGGRGKSSVAARLCDRLRREFQRIVVIGRFDEPTLINAWAPELSDDAARLALREPANDLRFRIEAALLGLIDAGRLSPLFVLDDFEQNQPQAADGDRQLEKDAAKVLLALCEALEHTGVGRVLITCRYALPEPFAAYLHTEDVPPLDATEQKKQSQRLEQKAARQIKDTNLLAQALIVADGNPRLFEWLHAVLAKPGLDHAGILDELRQVEEKFREDILARRLIASLPEEDRVLLGRLLLLTVPIPLAAVLALDPGRGELPLRQALASAADLGLVDITTDAWEPYYRVPRQLEGGDPPLLPVPADAESKAIARDVFEVLYRVWWAGEKAVPEGQMLELIRLGAAAGREQELAELARAVTTSWLGAHRYGETATLLEPLLDEAGRHPMLLVNIGRAKRTLGYGKEAGALLKEAVATSGALHGAERAGILFQYIEWLGSQGELDEVVRISREELLPMLTEMGAERERAVTLGTIADVLARRGELDEALRIRREEQLPVYERLGDIRSRAVALGKIADVLEARGELDEALRIRREEELPVYERLGDVRSGALTLGKIADVLEARGELDEALRIRRAEQLPVFERLGDVRSRAVTLGKIAGVLEARGELDEALRIRREEQLPVFERLGDVRERALTLGKITDVLVARGELDEALRIYRDELLPAFERLGDVRSRAVTLGKIAGVLTARGELDEALLIFRNELLPIFEHLGDVRERAVTLGKIADVLAARGEVDEALRIRREEVLPVYERLNDARSLIIGRVNVALFLLQRQRKEDIPEIVEHLVWAYQTAAQRGYREAAQIADIFRRLELPLPEV